LASYANALVVGAALCVVAGLLATEVRSTSRTTDLTPPTAAA
jgi:hypothetical protein